MYFSSKQKAINSKIAVWAYNAKTLALIKGSPFISMQKLAEYSDASYRTIGSYLDTEISTNLNGQLVYLFSKEISVELQNELVNNLTKANNAITEVWVYKGNQLNLINYNKPFKSKLQASIALNVSGKTISKYLDTNLFYKELMFFSEEKGKS